MSKNSDETFLTLLQRLMQRLRAQREKPKLTPENMAEHVSISDDFYARVNRGASRHATASVLSLRSHESQRAFDSLVQRLKDNPEAIHLISRLLDDLEQLRT